MDVIRTREELLKLIESRKGESGPSFMAGTVEPYDPANPEHRFHPGFYRPVLTPHGEIELCEVLLDHPYERDPAPETQTAPAPEAPASPAERPPGPYPSDA